MEKNKEEELDNLILEIKDYLETRSKLGKLKALDKGSQIAADSTTAIFIAVVLLLFLVFISLACALILSEFFNKLYAGFLIVSLFYLLTGFLLYFKRAAWIKKPIINALIRNFFKDTDDEY